MWHWDDEFTFLPDLTCWWAHFCLLDFCMPPLRLIWITAPLPRITARHFTSLHCVSLHLTLLRLTSLRLTSLYLSSLFITSLHLTSLHLTLLHCATLHITLHITAPHFTSLRLTLHHCTLHHCASHHCASPYFTAYHFTVSQVEFDVVGEQTKARGRRNCYLSEEQAEMDDYDASIGLISNGKQRLNA